MYKKLNSLTKRISLINSTDWQYLSVGLLLIICFLVVELFNSINKIDFCYSPGLVFLQPHRIFSSHFIHKDLNHLFSNLIGIMMIRYFLISLKLKSKYFFLIIVSFLIPCQTLLQWLLDSLFNNHVIVRYGFSGIIFGFYSFILLVSLYGKKRFLKININILSNLKIAQSISIITILSFAYSFLPGVSLLGHSTGYISGLILFLF